MFCSFLRGPPSIAISRASTYLTKRHYVSTASLTFQRTCTRSCVVSRASSRCLSYPKNNIFFQQSRLQRWNSTKGTGSSNGANSSSGAANNTQNPPSTFLQRFLSPKPMPPKYTPRWYGEMVLICTVFAITGSSTMFLVRPAMTHVLGLQGSLKDGPWSYRICSIIIMTPIYSTLLVIVGTIFGRHAYFRHFSVKMFSRFGIPPELMDKNFHQNAKNFRKW